MFRLVKSIIIFGGAQLFTVLAAILRNKIAANTIGASGLGLSAIYQTISQLVTNIANMGLPDSAVQGLSSIEQDEKRSEGVAILRLWEVITGMAAMLLVLIASPLICYVYFGNWHENIIEMVLLSVVPPCFIINGIELAILKSYGATRRLTQTIVSTALLSVIISIPIYIYVGWNGIIYVIVLSAIATALVAVHQAWRVCPAKPDISLFSNPKMLWAKSSSMILLGLSLVITGVGSMSAELLTQTYFSVVASLTMVGFYKAGYQLSITYPCMIFAAVSNDYYPRLSKIVNSIGERNRLVKNQIKALLLVVTPCIAVFCALAPYVIDLLLSDEYLAITDLVRIGCLAVIVRSVSLPLCFIPLAAGHSRDFIQMELLSYIALMLCIIAGFHFFGLTGIGYGILASNIFDLMYGFILAKKKYDFR